MKLTILDQNEHIVTTLSSDSFQAESAPVLSAKVQEVLNDKHVLTFETTAAGIEAQNILEEYYVIAKVNEQYREFVIKEITDSDDTDLLKNVKAMLSSVELNDELITTEVKGASDAQTALSAIVKGTRWTVGYVDPSIYNNQFTEKVQFQSVLEAIYTLAKFYNCDVHFSYVVNDLKVTARKVNLYRQLGTDAGKRFEIDKDITSIERTVDTTAIKTAIYPIRITEEEGKQTITTVADVVWSKASGDPADKPKGQPWVGDPTALKNWGRVNSDGTLRHRFKLYEYNEDVSPETMLQMAWVSLGQYTQPKITYEAKVVDLYQLTGSENYKHESVNLGDTCVVIDRYFAIPIETVDRVIEINRDLLEAENTVVTLGTKKDSYTSNRESDLDYAQQQAQGAKDLAESAVTSANGKNTNYYGSLEPKYPNKGDSWIRPHPENPEETQWLIWDGVQWVIEIDTSRISEIEKLAEKAESEAQAAIAEANSAAGTALDAHNKALEAAATVSSMEGKIAYVQSTLEDKASKSQVTQLADQLTSVVTTADGHSSQIVQLSNQITSVVTSVNAIDKKLSWNEISAATNLNNMTETGHFFMKGTLTNSPITAPAYLTVDAVSATNIKQTIQKDNATDIYYRTYTAGIWGSWERGAKYSQITQMEDMINLKVSKNDVVNQINVSTEGILISGKKIQITGDTYIQNGVITSAKIASLEADKITAGTLNAANVKIVNLDVDSLVGNITSFVQTAWNGINGSLKITSKGMESFRDDGTTSAKYLGDGIQIWGRSNTWIGSLSSAKGDNMVLWAKQDSELHIGYQPNKDKPSNYSASLIIDGTTGEIDLNRKLTMYADIDVNGKGFLGTKWFDGTAHFNGKGDVNIHEGKTLWLDSIGPYSSPTTAYLELRGYGSGGIDISLKGKNSSIYFSGSNDDIWFDGNGDVLIEGGKTLRVDRIAPLNGTGAFLIGDGSLEYEWCSTSIHFFDSRIWIKGDADFSGKTEMSDLYVYDGVSKYVPIKEAVQKWAK